MTNQNITIYVPDLDVYSDVMTQMEIVSAELEKRTAGLVHAKLSFKKIPSYSIYSKKNIEHLFEDVEDADAVIVNGDISNLIANDYVLDITSLMQEHAPYLYYQLQINSEALQKVTYDDKLMAIPSLASGSKRICVAIREDFISKYGVKKMSDFDDYEAFMKLFKDNEKSMLPAAFGNINTTIFLQKYGYVVLDGYLVYKWNDEKIQLKAWELTDEYKEAYFTIRNWMQNQYLDTSVDSIDKLVDSIRLGKVASFVAEWDTMQKVISRHNSNYSYQVYPLYMDMPAPRSGSDSVIVINKKTQNAKSLLKLLDWIQSNQENYDLFIYGIEGIHYSLSNDMVSLEKKVYYGWPGCSTFENDRYIRQLITDPPGFIDLRNRIINSSGYPPTFNFKNKPDDQIAAITLARNDFFKDDMRLSGSGKTPENKIIDIIIGTAAHLPLEGEVKYPITNDYVSIMQKELDDWLKYNAKG